MEDELFTKTAKESLRDVNVQSLLDNYHVVVGNVSEEDGGEDVVLELGDGIEIGIPQVQPRLPQSSEQESNPGNSATGSINFWYSLLVTDSLKYRSVETTKRRRRGKKNGHLTKQKMEEKSGNVLPETSLLTTRSMSLVHARKPKKRPNHFFAIQVFDDKVGY